MKIGLIGSFYKLYDEEYIARAFEKLGHKVIRYQYDKTSDEDILKDSPDLVLTVKRDLAGDFGNLIGRVKTAFWLFDLFWGTPREYKIKTDPMFKSDFVFTTDGGNHKKFRELGINHYVMRQGIIDEEAFITKPDFKKYPEEIVFVGTVNPWYLCREKMVQFLKDTYRTRFKRYGLRSSNEIRGIELNKLYSSAKVVVGDSMDSPDYWSNRIYDVLGRGGFLIFSHRRGLEEEYIAGKHYIPYRKGDLAGLKNKIDYYLEHPEEREKIRKEAFRHTIRNHTAIKRCQMILKILNS